MKKIVLCALLAVFCTTVYSQKKKSGAKKGGSANVLASNGSLSAQLTTSKNRFFVLLTDKVTKGTDTLTNKKIDLSGNSRTPSAKDNNIPSNCTIVPFVVRNTPLVAINWTENNVNEQKEKTEDRTQQYTEIWNIGTKSQVFANVQTTTKIKEILWLDKLKNASQTSEKLRREGFELTLTKEGDIVLKNKTQENKMVFNPGTNMYEDVKSAPAKAKKK